MEEEVDNLVGACIAPPAWIRIHAQLGDATMIRILFVVALATVFLSTDNARANSLNAERLLGKLAALEARVAALETKNREYKRELEQARTQRRTEALKNVGLANAAMPARDLTPNQLTQTGNETGWTGFFWGAAAGGAATKSSTTSSERAAQIFPGNPPPFDLNGFNTSSLSGPTSNVGGFVDVFAGGDFQLARLVFGGQIEATASDLNFNSSGIRSYAYFSSAGPTGVTATGDYRPQVTSRWMASALLRAGILVDDLTLLYGIGGWTVAQFEARNLTDNPFYQPNESFWASGPTAGVGIERKLDSNWRVRAEYRYTRFDTAHTQDRFAFVSGPNSQTYSRSTQFDQSMQSGRIGFAYSFNPLK
ncbi:outer membrane beta-barrel protein [Bradyrhizobium sp. CSA112]|uniref:outer membrane protein n=1 Tax=Bradyrhizobium sp. CSA112 TaxID=2699170 RepID=UPI0023AEC6F9|nr:outer membrane beta-barrel protein [Bradyrhizobium sp. CSA112]MDE5454217.1 outer membrane beta-barrel protein [Bradyrhizobium sp. CSA112]